MKQYNISFWTFFSIILFSFCASGCHSKKKNNEDSILQKELSKVYDYKIPEDVSRLIFITDEGCPNCVLSFSQLILNNITDYEKNSLIFINSSGRNVDIDMFTSLHSPNIIISNGYPVSSTVLPRLGIVYLKPETQDADTTIAIDASRIEEQFKFILEKK